MSKKYFEKQQSAMEKKPMSVGKKYALIWRLYHITINADTAGWWISPLEVEESLSTPLGRVDDRRILSNNPGEWMTNLLKMEWSH